MLKRIQKIFILCIIFLVILSFPAAANPEKLLSSNEVFITIASGGKRLYEIDFTNYSDLESEFLLKFTRNLPKDWHMKVCIKDICLQSEYVTSKIKPKESSMLTIRLFAPENVELEKEISQRLAIGAIEDSNISEFLNIYIYPTFRRTLILWIDKEEALLNDEKLILNPSPMIKNSRTLVPFRFIGESFGAEIGWDNTERRVDYKFGRQKISLWIGKKNVEVSVGKETKKFELDSEPIIVNGRTLVPVRFISEQLGSEVGWDSKERKVTIKFPKDDIIPDDGKNAFFSELTAEEVHNFITEEKPMKIIDVRLRSEYDAGHIPNAINIPYQDIMEELPKRKDITKDDFIVLYCKTGERAAIASEILTNIGYKNVYNMIGGINAWKYEIEK